MDGNESNISRNSPPQIPVKLLHYFMTIGVIFLLKERKDWSRVRVIKRTPEILRNYLCLKNAKNS